jgi:RND family efflux transporter MFP subunit
MSAANAQTRQPPRAPSDEAATRPAVRWRGIPSGTALVAWIAGVAQTVTRPATRRYGRLSARARQRLSLGLRITISLLLLALVLSKAKVHKFIAVLATMDVPLALLGLGIGVVTIVLSAQVWQILLRRERIALGLPTVTGVYFLGHTFNQFLPSSIGGDVARAAYVGRFSGRGVGAASATLMSRVIGLLALFLTAIPTVVVAALVVPGLGWTLAVILLTAGAVFGACLYALLYSPTLIRRLVGVRISRFKIGRKLLDVTDAIAEYRQQRRALLAATLVSLVFYLASNLNFYVYGRALHLQAPFWFYWFAIPLTSLATLLPISLNGYGVRGASFALVFAVAHEPAARALSLSSAMELQMAIFALVGAGVLVAFNRRLAAAAIGRKQPGPVVATAPAVAAPAVAAPAGTHALETATEPAPAANQQNGHTPGSGAGALDVLTRIVPVTTPPEDEEAGGEPPRGRPPRRWRQMPQRGVILPALAALLLVVMVGTLGAQRLLKTTPKVQLYTVTTQQLTSSIGGGGLTYPIRQLDIAYPISSQVITVNVQVGQRVAAGQSLLTLDAASLSLQRDQARAQWQIAQTFVNRLLQGGATATEIAAAQQQAQVAESQYNRLNALLASPSFNQGSVVAPFAGTITDLNVNPGTIFRANNTLLSLADASTVIVRAQFPLTQAAQMRIGAPVEIDPAATSGQRFTGTVLTINTQLRDKGSSSFEAWITVPNPHGALFLGESVYARVASTQAMPAVPELAVINPQSNSIVFVYAGGRAHIRHVVVGLRDGDRFGIASGLNPGDQVILVGQYQLDDDEPVRVTKVLP